MKNPQFNMVQVGTVLPDLVLPPLSRLTLALYAGASGDHVPLHIDIDFARRSGMPDVFGHGMLNVAWLSRMLTGWVSQHLIRKIDVRFIGITHLHNELTCSGRVIEKCEVEGEHRVRIEIVASNQYGEKKVVGEALIALP